MEYTKLIVEKQDAVCVVKINNPQAMNALNTTVLGELDAAFTEIEKDKELKVVIITGEGFCSRSRHLTDEHNERN